MDNIFNKKLPYLTKNIPGIGGKIKQYNEDFIVTEIPLYECTHDGEHIFLEIEKNIATFDIIQKIASQLTISKKTIGYAGIKDKNAITRQYVSVPYSQKDNIKNINIQGLSILSTQRHKNKLHIGHLKGNAFKILIRECTPLLDNVNKILSILSQRGVPNYFGQQRFGYNNSTGVLGKYLLQEEYEKFIETIFMRSSKDTPLIEETKLLIHNKQYGEALKIIPRGFAVEKNILKHLSKGKSFEYAINRIDKKMKNFYICAYQSNLFNSLLADRIEKIDTIYYGDIAIKHPGRAAFKVEDEEAEKNDAVNLKYLLRAQYLDIKCLMPSVRQEKKSSSSYKKKILIQTSFATIR